MCIVLRLNFNISKLGYCLSIIIIMGFVTKFSSHSGIYHFPTAGKLTELYKCFL